MKTFSFVIIVNDNKYCFVHQYQAETLTNDLVTVLVHETPHIPQKIKPLFINEIMECYHDEPVKVNRVDNVWRDIFLIDDLMALYNTDIAKKYHEGDDRFYELMYRYDVDMIETDMSDTEFPLAKSATFTFICQLRTYNDIQQFKVSTIEEGLKLWAASVAILNRQQRKILLKYIQKSKNNPVAVDGLKNVWSTSYKIFRPILTLHIIKTV